MKRRELIKTTGLVAGSLFVPGIGEASNYTDDWKFKNNTSFSPKQLEWIERAANEILDNNIFGSISLKLTKEYSLNEDVVEIDWVDLIGRKRHFVVWYDTISRVLDIKHYDEMFIHVTKQIYMKSIQELNSYFWNTINNDGNNWRTPNYLYEINGYSIVSRFDFKETPYCWKFIFENVHTNKFLRTTMVIDSETIKGIRHSDYVRRIDNMVKKLTDDNRLLNVYE